jgi:hypothetical protein
MYSTTVWCLSHFYLLSFSTQRPSLSLSLSILLQIQLKHPPPATFLVTFLQKNLLSFYPLIILYTFVKIDFLKELAWNMVQSPLHVLYLHFHKNSIFGFIVEIIHIKISTRFVMRWSHKPSFKHICYMIWEENSTTFCLLFSHWYYNNKIKLSLDFAFKLFSSYLNTFDL